MRPIYLRFKGLHSYKEMQEVDFERLCEGGLFGIFGPTGSGKSTVLDAITLALYARVERAGGQRQGILNEACDDLLVDFTFELGQGVQTRRYQVERRYRRSGPTNVAVSFARLTEHRGEQREVIADKDRDVTESVERILGLTHSDFTRAVVLPQGKFAEFLQMTGTDRRAMLERLFALQDYGQRLSDRIRARLDDVENRLSGIKGAQGALVDASVQAVAEAKQAAKEAAAAAETARKHLEKVRTAHKKAEEQRRVQRELEEVRVELRTLDKATPQIEAAREELRLAEAAEPIRRDLEEVERAQQERAQAEAELKNAEELLAKAEAAYTRASTAYDQARRAREKEEPELRALLSRLQEGLSKEERLADRRAKAASLHERLDGLRGELQAVDEELADIRERIAAGEGQLSKKETELRILAIEPGRRRTIQQAAVALDRLRETEGDISRLRTEVEAAEQRAQQAADAHTRAERQAEFYRKELEARRQELHRLESTPPGSEEELARDADFIARAQDRLEQLAATEADLGRIGLAMKEAENRNRALGEKLRNAQGELQHARAEESSARAALERAEEALRLAELEHQAAALARHLTAGAPCPVCGSVHHPSPAEQPETNAEYSTELHEARTRLKTAEEARAVAEERVRDLEQQLADVTLTMQHTEAEQNRLLSRQASLYAQLPSSWHGRRAAEIEVELTQEQASYVRRKEAFDTWREQVTKLRAEIEDQRTMVEQATYAAAKCGQERARAEAELEAVHGALNKAEAERDTHAALLHQAAGALSPAQIEAELKRIDDADTRTEQLQGEIDALRTDLTRRRGELTDHEARRTALHNEIIQAEADLRIVEQEIGSLQDELTALTGGRAVRELIDETAARLTRLAEDEERERKSRDEAAAQLAAAERQKDAAQHSLRIAFEQERAGKERLLSQLAEAGFGSVAAAQDALRTADARNKLRERITEHEQAISLLNERRIRLELQLDGNWIDDETWERLQEELTEAESVREQALYELSAAQKEAAEREQRHKDWLALEAERIEAQSLKDRLLQLQDLCRGRKFVEFVAEEYLASVTAEASRRLGSLTSGRYALELDSSGGFVIRDDANGGVRRPVSSLSGGETFVTSLALALALSKQIQLHGTYPLEFFFLDEGFGTLDPELLETVMTSLEKLRNEQVSIGIISHVPELRQRVARRLIVHHARESDRGSWLEFERG